MTAALWALIAGPALWAMTLYEPARLTGDGQIAGAGTQVALEPEQWIGQPFPLRDYLEVPDDLSTARWVVVLISPDCSLCRQAATRYGRIASDLAGHPESPRWALVTLPGDSAEGLVADGTPAIVGRLSDRVAWHMPVPVEITLRDGVVTGVRTKVIPRIEDFVGL
jgi:hypothetical protein